ncbi:60s ribosome biogenesis protein mak11 [Dispira parvispora]|uniref:60s ribosome biogenesis protein mak11 n=1 Tax=Dispira parvispora TaxID=1520584 RepID=A0A9W8E0G5_9FUNG|nr:60s ribosome biogenesis protein mak11 [Dispira parvispora]
MASGGTFLASGGTDELIKLYDLKRKRELGALMQHQGTLTALEFYQDTHLLSAGEDGLVCIWRAKDWECLAAMKGHKGRVNSIAIHPSGRLALSVGNDRTLRLWNLLNGHKASVHKLGREGLQVLWCDQGQKYVILYDRNIVVYNITDASVASTISLSTRVHCITTATLADAPESVEYLVCGGDDKHIYIYELETGQLVTKFLAHSNRVRCVAIVNSEKPGASQPTTLVISASTDGTVTVWDLATVLKGTADGDSSSMPSLGSYNIDCRLTTMSAVSGQ